MRRERIGILGLGLIGGSLAQALRGKRGGPEVWGCDRKAASVRAALSDGAIARGCRPDELTECDVVVVCLPVLSTVAALERLGKVAAAVGKTLGGA